MHAESNPHSVRVDAEADRQAQALGYLLGRQMSHANGDTLPSFQPAQWEMSDEPVRRRFAFHRVAEDIANPKPLAWLVRGILERDCLGLLFGQPGAGKSFVAVDLAVCVATGTAFVGHSVAPGGVLFIAGEGGNGLARRFDACAKAKGLILDGSTPLLRSNMAAAMTDVDSVRELLAALADYTEQHGAPALIVVDTVARSFGGGDENSTQDMSRFIAACDAVREMTGACVLLVHHSGHADQTRARGSIALKGALDWEYSVGKDPSGVLHLTCTKVKDAEPPPPIAFRLTSFDLGITDEEGEPVTSAVLMPTMFMGGAAKGKIGRGKNQLKARRVLEEGVARCRAHFEHTGQDTDTAWMSLSAWRDVCAENGMDRHRFAEVVSTLKEQGFVYVNADRVTLGDGHVYEPVPL